MLNNFTITGRMTREAEMKTFGDTTIATFTIAQNKFSKRDESMFFDCKAFGKTAELIHDFCSKGDKIGIAGRIEQETWEKDGQKRSKVVLIVTTIDLPAKQKEQKEQPAPKFNHNPFGGGKVDINNNDFDIADLPF